MPLPLNKPLRISVRIRGEVREKIERRIGDQGVEAALRAAALRAIGREDLIDEPRNERGHKRTRKAVPEWVVMPVAVSPEQDAALRHAAKRDRRALSALMIDSLLEELRLRPRQTGAAKGWELGKRKSAPPKADRATAPKKAVKKRRQS